MNVPNISDGISDSNITRDVINVLNITNKINIDLFNSNIINSIRPLKLFK